MIKLEGDRDICNRILEILDMLRRVWNIRNRRERRSLLGFEKELYYKEEKIQDLELKKQRNSIEMSNTGFTISFLSTLDSSGVDFDLGALGDGVVTIECVH